MPSALPPEFNLTTRGTSASLSILVVAKIARFSGIQKVVSALAVFSAVEVDLIGITDAIPAFRARKCQVAIR